MPDPTNYIDALLFLLSDPHHSEHHAALTALVAERNALKQRVEEQDADIKALAAANAILHGRLESPADRDRELRERLVCALIVPAFELYSASLNVNPARYAVSVADETLAAMRKGATDGK